MLLVWKVFLETLTLKINSPLHIFRKKYLTERLPFNVDFVAFNNFVWFSSCSLSSILVSSSENFKIFLETFHRGVGKTQKRKGVYPILYNWSLSLFHGNIRKLPIFSGGIEKVHWYEMVLKNRCRNSLLTKKLFERQVILTLILSYKQP